MGSRALLLEVALAGLRDTSGVTISGAHIFAYDAGTLTPRSLYTDYTKATPAANPYSADSNGRAQLYGDGLYKIVIKNSSDTTTYYTWDNVPLFFDPGPLIYCGAAGGSANAQTITASPAITALATGMMFSFKSVGTNSGAVTLNANGIGAVAIKDAAGNALQAGDLLSGTLYEVTYDGTNFILSRSSTSRISQSEATTLISTASAVLVDYTGASVTVVTTAPNQNVLITATIGISVAAAAFTQAAMTIGADGVDQAPNTSWVNGRNNAGGQDDFMTCTTIEVPASVGSHTYKIRWSCPSAATAWSATYRLSAIVLPV